MANSFGIPSFEPSWWKDDIGRARKVVKEGSQVLIVSVVASEDSSLDATNRRFFQYARRP